MKGTISDIAAKILRDPNARRQLNKVVNSRTDGTVTLDGKTYSVRRHIYDLVRPGGAARPDGKYANKAID
jgi:hypothetical protein